MKQTLFTALIAVSLLFIGCGEDKKPTDSDEGNTTVIQTVTICDQVWMLKNLDVEYYRNGDQIRLCETDAEWIDAGSNLEGAWCYYNNDPVYGIIYGKLFNWYAVNDPRGLAPNGWHIPTDEEWKELEMCLGMSQTEADDTGPKRGTYEGGKLKARGTIEGGDGLWLSPNKGATNESGFSAPPGGFRYSDGIFGHIMERCHLWSSTEDNTVGAWFRSLNFGYSNIRRNHDYKYNGFSVRCVKD